ncbi:alkaline phosphatase [Owenweeksia hongkongensis]|uniref:alkaline phosphatase n=1 Tax=Owenweeksia hongkongensis TaxID=253245 RepID=UPI003A954D6C
MKVNFISLAFALVVLATCSSFINKDEYQKPKNIIIMIGDGMGLSQMSAAYYYGDREPNFSRFPIVGLSRTSSSSDKITDSAAGATAISAGKKTYNGAIGLDEDKKCVETLLEYFSKEGKSTGLVATSSITHATPASFFAHEKSRNSASSIAKQMLEAPVDFFAGGGLKYFQKGSLIQDLEEKGFTINTTELDKKAPKTEGGRLGYILADDGMPKMIEGRGEYLKNASELAIDFLKDDEDGFFVMIEGSQIDWGGHANNSKYLITEVVDFDQAVGAVLDFARKDGKTLVIVTADHETGGFTLAAEEKKVPFQGTKRDYNSIAPTFSTGGHSAAMVPVLAYGPGAEKFAGIYENTEIHAKILELVK